MTRLSDARCESRPPRAAAGGAGIVSTVLFPIAVRAKALLTERGWRRTLCHLRHAIHFPRSDPGDDHAGDGAGNRVARWAARRAGLRRIVFAGWRALSKPGGSHWKAGRAREVAEEYRQVARGAGAFSPSQPWPSRALSCFALRAEAETEPPSRSIQPMLERPRAWSP